MIREEKIQKAVAEKFEEIKGATRVDNYLTNTSTGGTVQPASATGSPTSNVTPAGGRATLSDQGQSTDPARRAAGAVTTPGGN
jgi:hypothetical protein